MTEIEQLDNILQSISNGQLVPSKFTFDDTKDYLNSINKLVAFGLIQSNINSNIYKLTDKGYNAIELGGFENWRQSKDKSTTPTVFATNAIIGNNNSNNHQDLSFLNNSEKLNPNTNDAKHKPITIETVAKIIGGLGSIAALIYGLLKMFNKT